MIKRYLGKSINNWASAIALRISDEWDENIEENKEDTRFLKEVLKKVLRNNPEECVKLIGTSIIEEDYFDKL
jgi:hypothetical protein